MKNPIYNFNHIDTSLKNTYYYGPEDELFDIWIAECRLCRMYLGVNMMEEASHMLNTIQNQSKESIEYWKEYCEICGEDPNNLYPKGENY